MANESYKALVGWVGALIVATIGIYIDNSLNDPSCKIAEKLVMDDKYNSAFSGPQKINIAVEASKKVIECINKNIEENPQ